MTEPQQIADKYLERYSKLTTSTTRIVLIALVVLLTNWLFIVETNFSKYKSVKQEYQYKFQAIENQFIELNKNFSDDTAAYKIKREELSTKKDELSKEKEKSLKDELSEVKDLPSLVKFIFFISDNLEKGGLILNILFFLLVVYLFFTRRTCLKYIAKAIRIYKIEPTLQINKYQDFNLISPLWIAPLPKRQNKDVTPQELKTVLGCTFTHNFLKSGLIITLIVILIIQSRLAFVTFIVNGSKFNTIFFISLLFVILTLLFIIFWLFPIKIEDNFNYESNPNHFSRRDFVTASVFGLFSIVIYKVSPYLPKYLHKRQPRFLAKKLKTNFSLPNLKSLLIKNTKSNIVHFINSFGNSSSFKNIADSNDLIRFGQHAQPFSEIEKLQTNRNKPRMPLGHSSWHSESFALEKIKSGNFIEATEILLNAIKQNLDNYSPSYRLHDLLALICIKYKTEVPVNTWQILIELSNNSKDKILVARAKKWSDKKWSDKLLNKKNITFNKSTI